MGSRLDGIETCVNPWSKVKGSRLLGIETWPAASAIGEAVANVRKAKVEMM